MTTVERPAYQPLGTFRFLLALLVVLQHYINNYAPHGWFGEIAPSQIGSVAVYVFFVISGYVIISAADNFYLGKPLPFLVNRLIRIVPLYVLAVAVSSVVLWYLNSFAEVSSEKGVRMSEMAFSSRNLIANLMAVFPTPGRYYIAPEFSFLRIVWALRVEMLFYFSVFLILAFAGLLSSFLSFSARLSFLRISSLVAVMALAWYGASNFYSISHNPMLDYAPYFVAGASFYFFMRGTIFPKAILSVALGMTFVDAFYRLSAGDALGIVGSGSAEFILFVFLTLVFGVLCSRRLDSPRLDRVFGDLSYPVYLGHWLPILIVATIWTSPTWVTMTIGVSMSMALPVLYLVTLEPFTKRLRQRLRGVAIR